MQAAPDVSAAVERWTRTARPEGPLRRERRSSPPLPGLLALQRSAGNAAVASLVSVQRCGDGKPCDCGCGPEQDEATLGVQREAAPGAPPKERLESPKLAGNDRLDRGFRNSPAIHIGESGDGVRLVQEVLVDDGLALPGSTKPDGALDGGFGQETLDRLREFQGNHGLDPDGIAGHDTLEAMDTIELGGEPPLLKPRPGDEPPVLELPGGLQILVPGGGGTPELPGLGPLGNLFGSPGGKKKPDPPKTKPTPEDLADEAACGALPASQMGKAVDDVISWRSSADDATMLSRLADIVCFPPEYKLLVTGIAVGLLPPLPGQPQRQAMLAHMALALDDFTAALELAQSPEIVNLGLPQLPDARAKKISDRIGSLRAIATAQSSEGISAKRLAAATLAAGEVGKVDHRMVESGRRLGGDRLLEYFRVAFGGTVPPTVQSTIVNPPKDANVLKECTPTQPKPCDPLPPWCGIFASWAYQNGGVPLPNWSLTDNKGINQRGAWRQLTKKNNDEILPGDLATRAAGNHQGIVIAVTSEGIETAEGNTNEGSGTGFEAAVGGRIAHKSYAGQGLDVKGWDTGFWRPPGAD